MIAQFPIIRHSLVAIGLGTLAAASAFAQAEEEPSGQPASEFKIESPAFEDGESIPSRHTCDGEDVSPEFTWEGTPEATRSFAMIFDDPKTAVGVWVHWVIYNIPGDAVGLPEAVPAQEVLENGTVQGKSSWGKIGFRGSCPPAGEHTYHFKLYALDARLDLPPGATKKELLKAMEGHTLGETQITGRYERER